MVAMASAFKAMPKMVRSSKISAEFNIDRAISTLSRNKILTKTAQLGLLSKLENAGFTLTTAVPLLIFAEENDLIGVLEASSEKVLPLIGTAIELAPGLLPFAAIALNTKPTVFFGAAAASAGAAAAAVFLIPDDNIALIAAQTLLALPLGVLLPGGLAVGGLVVGKIESL
eukprot:CAMPEP_0119038946 /NCGR_PEP_ID=MMETSP1177-20130426/8159_1 /TAXON_ID=2985 /ORGANISM="Ochromonas sp, Strain CCMP1899" /LENGTH=170 /DNA_ID=CAMNT_0007002183 /DNA_START=111 /DNA_END=623 /DNA_ORIENTATION=+